MFEIVNKPVSILTTASNYENRYVKGIRLSRFGASWLKAGGCRTDHAGFILWMMNIPFENEKGEIEYISQDDAQDAYDMMTMGKFELENSIREFLIHWDSKHRKWVE